MQKLKFVFFISLLGFLLAGCGEKAQEEDEIPLPLEVDLTVQETADVGESVSFEAVVTQGEEKITDADEVVYEVWEEGNKEEGEMIDSKNQEDGTYIAEKAFEKDGVYNVQVHVTARGLHTMPTKTVIVGDAELPEGGDEHDHGDGHHDHGDTAFSMHIMKPEDVKLNNEFNLVVHLEFDGKPLEEARVRYEIWQENNADAAHDWVNATEDIAGEYVGMIPFNEIGTYSIQVHVEDGEDLHEHETFQVEVKE